MTSDDKRNSFIPGMTIKISSNDSRGGTRSKNTIEEDLKETLDKRLMKFEASLNSISQDKEKETPMKRFFADEIEFTRDLLNRIRLDIDLIGIENAKVMFMINLSEYKISLSIIFQ